jgi:hypothetical protein
MASTYTTRIKLEKQGDGENANTWGQRLNNNVIDVVDDAIAGYHTVNVEGLSGDITLDDGDGGAANDARNFGLNFKGAMTSDITIIVPAREKIYFLHNEATGGNIFIKPTGGTAVTVAESMMVATSGTLMNTLVGFTPDSITSDVSIQGNLFVSGNVSVGGTVSAPNIHATTKIHAPAISVSNLSATTIFVDTISCSTLSATDVRATNVCATNIHAATVSADVVRPDVVSATTRIQAPLVCATNISAVNIYATTKIHAPAISASHVSATSMKISSNLSVGGIVSAATVEATTVKAGSLLIGGVTKDNFPSGTKMLFQQTAAPTGWTKDTTHNDKALRITNGTASTGGSVAFETAFASQTPSGSLSIATPSFSGTVSGHTLTTSEIPTHSHFSFSSTRNTVSTITQANLNSVNAPYQQHRGNGADFAYMMANSSETADVGKTSETGSGSSHSHGFSGTVGDITGSFSGDAINLDVQYVDVIIATKD